MSQSSFIGTVKWFQVLFVCLGFMAYQPLWVIQCKINFYSNKQFYLKQYSLALVNSLSKIFLFQAIQFSQTVLIQTIQFNISIIFDYTLLMSKKFPFKQFILSYKNNSI